MTGMNIKSLNNKQLRAVLIVLNNFNPDGRVLKEANSLVNQNLFVSVCAMHESGLAENENRDGLDVQRIRLRSRSLPKIRIIQIFKYLEFIFRAIARFRSYDIAHCNDLNALPIGVLMKCFNRKLCLIYDAHEYEIHTSSKQGPLSIKLRFYMEGFLIKFTNGVIVTSQADSVEYGKLYKIPEPNIVMNCPVFSPTIEDRGLFRSKFNIPSEQVIYIYQGALTEARGIRVMLETFSGIEDDSACIVFMGFGYMQATIEEYALRHKSIHVHPAVSPEELHKYTASADCGIIFMANTCANHNYALPNKLFEYVMADIPTLTTPLQEITRIVNEHNIGFVSSGEDTDSLSTLVHTIKKQDIEALKPALQNARTVFTWENQEKIMFSTYQAGINSAQA